MNKRAIIDAATNLFSASDALTKAADRIVKGLEQNHLVLDVFEVVTRANHILTHAEHFRDLLLEMRNEGSIDDKTKPVSEEVQQAVDVFRKTAVSDSSVKASWEALKGDTGYTHNPEELSDRIDELLLVGRRLEEVIETALAYKGPKWPDEMTFREKLSYLYTGDINWKPN